MPDDDWKRDIKLTWLDPHKVYVAVIRMPENFTLNDVEAAQTVGQHLRDYGVTTVILPQSWGLEFVEEDAVKAAHQAQAQRQG